MKRVAQVLALSIPLCGFSFEEAGAACPAPLTNGSPANADIVMDWFECLQLDPTFTGRVGINVTALSPYSFFVNGRAGGSQSFELDGNVGQLIASSSSTFYSIPSVYALTTGSGVGPLAINPAGGNVGIGTVSPVQALDVVGTIRQTGCKGGMVEADEDGDLICDLDARLRNVNGVYTMGLSAINRLVPQRFTYRTEQRSAAKSLVRAGFNPQNVRAAIPEAAPIRRDGYYGLDLVAVVATSVNAIKELKTLNDRQAAEIGRLRARLSKLESGVKTGAASATK